MNASPAPFPRIDASVTPLIAPPWDGYALIDSGRGRKLERYGEVIVNRPEPQALWEPSLPEPVWDEAHAAFCNTGDDDSDSGKWKILRPCPEEWPVTWKGLTFICRLMSFRHMGLFPEQLTHWDWVAEKIRRTGGQPNILNLFAYTGAATLSAAQAGAQVTHLDASKKAIQWGKDNQAASGLSDAPIRWICDDAKAFVAREIRRGKTYDGIILDPPKFGRGPDGERWQIETDLIDILKDCVELLGDKDSFLVLTAYAMRLSSMSIAAALQDALTGRGGAIEQGELLIAQTGDSTKPRFLSTSLYARWSGE